MRGAGRWTLFGVEERDEHGFRVFQVKEPNALTQLVGWLKFTAADGQVLYRGQERIFPDMFATGLRPAPGAPRAETLSKKLRKYIDEVTGGACNCVGGKRTVSFARGHTCREVVGGGTAAIVSGTQRAAVEPLLQHYGVPTRWLDVVDNIWIALWFACHTQVTEGRHAFHRRRSVGQEGAESFAYVAVLETGQIAETAVRGYAVGPESRLIDLRYAVPSVYLRPHAQHGLLLAPGRLRPGDSGSMKKQVAAYIEVRLEDALQWLGEGAMLSTYVLFPPAVRDEGYRRLLDFAPPPPTHLGSITQFGPGI